MNSNPLLDGLALNKEPVPFALFIFGATGDLTKKKLIPALFSLFTKGNISHFKILGFARRAWSKEVFQDEARKMLEIPQFSLISKATKEAFIEKLDFISSTFDDPEGYKKMALASSGFEGRLFYMSTSPEDFPTIIENLGKSGLNKSERGYSRLIVEKPVGRDLATAKALNNQLAQHFDESQIYRIDHYLGKETVQNILVLRFGNGIFEPLWNNRFIDHVQITVAESVAVGTRANYYEKSGALRDMVQNHMLQLLTLLTMEPPNDLLPDTIRTEKVKILKSLRPITHKEVEECTVRGQYSPGIVQGAEMKGYLQENGVNPDSTTETFVALKLHLDTWRWAGVPFFLRTGKALGRKVSEIAIFFKDPPHEIFKTRTQDPAHNSLIIHIQPEEGITFNVNAKIPGYTNHTRPVNMDFAYGAAFGEEVPEAYERLILDALVGDSTLYTRRDEIETSWSFITRILQGWQHQSSPLPQYKAGSSGPEEAKNLLGSSHRKWRKI